MQKKKANQSCCPLHAGFSRNLHLPLDEVNVMTSFTGWVHSEAMSLHHEVNATPFFADWGHLESMSPYHKVKLMTSFVGWANKASISSSDWQQMMHAANGRHQKIMVRYNRYQLNLLADQAMRTRFR